MKYRIYLILVLTIFLSIACLGQSSLRPPENSSGEKFPLFPNTTKISLDDSDKNNLLLDVISDDALDYSSSVDISWTEDSGDQVKQKLDETIPETDWRMEVEWTYPAAWTVASRWKNGDLYSEIVIFDNLDNETISEFRGRYGIQNLEPGSTLIITYVWDTSLPLPTDTPEPTITPYPTATFPPTQTPLPTVTPLPSLTPNPNSISFSSENNPNELNPVFSWERGESPVNSYDLTVVPGSLTLISGPNTAQWEQDNSAPMIIFQPQGDFTAQVKVNAQASMNIQQAGFGVRSTQNHKTWLRITHGNRGIQVEGNTDGKALDMNDAYYSEETVFLRIERQGFLFSFAYSPDGLEWTTVQNNYVFDLSNPVDMYFIVYSNQNDSGYAAHFNDFVIEPR